MEDRDEVLLAALAGLLDARLAQFKVELREEMHGMRQELREEMQDMKKELREEMQDMKKELQEEIKEVREEVKEVREEIKEVREDLQGVKIYIENVLERKLNAFYDNTVRVTEFNKLKEEVEELKKSS